MSCLLWCGESRHDSTSECKRFLYDVTKKLKECADDATSPATLVRSRLEPSHPNAEPHDARVARQSGGVGDLSSGAGIVRGEVAGGDECVKGAGCAKARDGVASVRSGERRRGGGSIYVIYIYIQPKASSPESRLRSHAPTLTSAPSAYAHWRRGIADGCLGSPSRVRPSRPCERAQIV